MSPTAVREELLAAYAELGNLEKMKGAFVARASHELRTPVTIAKLAVELVKAEVPAEGSAFRALALADEAIARLERRVEDVLAFSSLADGRFLRRAPVDVAALLREAADSHAALAAERRIDAAIAAPEGLIVSADPSALAKAFGHLYQNALRFSREGGVVRVAAEAAREHAYLRFRDSAPPIPEADRLHAFDGFYQAAEHMTRRADGLGLGLALARRAVEAHGGRLTLETAEHGNVFAVRLPRGL